MKIAMCTLFTFCVLSQISTQEIEIYSNKWIPAVVNDTNVNVRDGANLDARVLFQVQNGEYLYIIGQTTESQRIGEWESVWYKVTRPRGDEFWIYGEFVTILGESDTIRHGYRPGGYFSYLDENDYQVPDGVYGCTEVYQKSTTETLAIDQSGVNSGPWQIIFHNNTFGVFKSGALQTLRSTSSLLVDLISSETGRVLSPGEDGYYQYTTGGDLSLKGSTLTLDIIYGSTIILSESSYHISDSTLYKLTFQKDFQGTPDFVEWEPDYPIGYLAYKTGNLTFFTAPEQNSASPIIEIPDWDGKESHSIWEEIQPITSYEDMQKLSTDELPLFTVRNRLGNEGSRRWYQISYDGNEGYILVDPTRLSTVEDYFDHLELWWAHH